MNPVVRPALAILLLAATTCGSDAVPPPFSDEREPCADNNPLRNLYFGDLHVHTALSADAYLAEVRTTPEQAYAFARGEEVKIAPLDADGKPTRTHRIDRPLDFAAVTDHAEFLGEVSACTTEGSDAYDSDMCQDVRASDETMFIRYGNALTKMPPERFSEICGGGKSKVDCRAVAGDVWKRVQDAAEAAYDRTEACEFTSFVAYEWSASTDISNRHRNVIFRSKRVPELPTSYFEASVPQALWDALQSDCLDKYGDCDVIAIPHNSNWSNGNLFHLESSGDPEEDAAAAAFRADLEPLVEIYQHKGDSECMNGISGVLGEPDELCEFEKLRRPPFDDCGDGTGDRGMINLGCVSRRDYVRGVLLAGLQEEIRVGVNPFRLGIIASTDTHNGIPGAVSEQSYPGHFGRDEDSPEDRLALSPTGPDGVKNGSGGLVAVWAEENSRDAIFDAMKRREVYGTSGPRIAVRTFAGWNLPDDMCSRADWLETGYGSGVPMGGVLGERPAGATAPSILVSAIHDAGTMDEPGAKLERIQIVKGWVDEAGQSNIRVYDVAGQDEGATPDPDTCAPPDVGAESLCTTWVDPEFDPQRPAFYYARVLEQPTCRWSTRECQRLQPAEQPEACSDPDVRQTVRERAWTSPIWFETQ